MAPQGMKRRSGSQTPQQAKTKKALDRIQVEISIMRMTSHPGIIKLYETFEDMASLRTVVDVVATVRQRDNARAAAQNLLPLQRRPRPD